MGMKLLRLGERGEGRGRGEGEILEYICSVRGFILREYVNWCINSRYQRDLGYTMSNISSFSRLFETSRLVKCDEGSINSLQTQCLDPSLVFLSQIYMYLTSITTSS